MLESFYERIVDEESREIFIKMFLLKKRMESLIANIIHIMIQDICYSKDGN